jgi:hypothetical protein
MVALRLCQLLALGQWGSGREAELAARARLDSAALRS